MKQLIYYNTYTLLIINILCIFLNLRAIGLEVNGSKCEFTILNDSMPETRETLFWGLLPRSMRPQNNRDSHF